MSRLKKYATPNVIIRLSLVFAITQIANVKYKSNSLSSLNSTVKSVNYSNMLSSKVLFCLVATVGN
jgi:hypothetical protein